jgi:hypothetical protein
MLPPKIRNTSDYELDQERRAKADLDSCWHNNWGRDRIIYSSTTTSSSTTKNPYDIWLHDRESIWIEERARLMKIANPREYRQDPNLFEKLSEPAPSGRIVTPPVWVLLWRWLVKFFKRFHKWNRHTGFFR